MVWIFCTLFQGNQISPDNPQTNKEKLYRRPFRTQWVLNTHEGFFLLTKKGVSHLRIVDFPWLADQ
jgi:hypothetical protein